jgi:hypothetical protein
MPGEMLAPEGGHGDDPPPEALFVMPFDDATLGRVLPHVA